MSNLISEFSFANSKSAMDLTNSVLPTPVGPKKKDPIDFVTSPIPVRLRVIAADTDCIASS